MKKKSNLNPRVAIAWTIILIAAFVSFYFGATNLFIDKGSFRLVIGEVWHWVLMTVGGIFFMLIAIWQLSADQIGGVSAFFARIGQRRIGPLAHFIPSSIHANTRNVKNLIGFLTLGVALVTSLTILSDTVMLGNKATNQSYLGGDITVYSMVPRSSLAEIRGLPGITGATIYTGAVMESWSYNFDQSYSYVVNTADGYGGRDTNVTQNLNVIVIEPSEYLAMNPVSSPIHNEFDPTIPSIYEIDKPNAFESPSDFIHRLDTPMTTIVGTPLLETLGKDVDDTVTLSINGFMGTMTIVGAASNLPAAPYMRLMDNTGYMTRTAFISRATFAAMLEDFVGNVDIMIKNMTIPTSLMNRTVSNITAGYTSGLINMTQIGDELSTVSGIDKIAYRFSTFAPGAPSLNATFNPSQLVWKHENVNASSGDEFPLPLRMYVVNGREDLFMSGLQQQVSESSSWAHLTFSNPGDSEVEDLLNWHYTKRVDTTAANVLYLIDKNLGSNRMTYFENTSLCVTNRYVVAYEDIDNETYVYEMKPMDKIKFSLELTNGTVKSFNFTVAATLDNHLSYWWQNGSMREGFKISSKSLNYNFKGNESSDLQDLFDLDANVFLTTRKELEYMATKLFGALAQFIGISELNGMKADEIANHVQIKVSAGVDVNTVIGAINTALNIIPGHNFSVIAYKRAFVDKIANTGVLSVNINVPETEALATLQSWFTTNGYTWNIEHVGTLARQNLGSDIAVAEPVFKIFFVVAIFSLVINAVGLCTILYANARNRHREYGIYKALGYTSHAIREMIFFETFLVSSIGIVSGVIAGIAMMFVLYQAIKSSIIVPMVFSIPIWTLLLTVVLLISIASFTSEAISRHVTRLSIVDNIRYRE